MTTNLRSFGSIAEEVVEPHEDVPEYALPTLNTGAAFGSSTDWTVVEDTGRSSYDQASFSEAAANAASEKDLQEARASEVLQAADRPDIKKPPIPPAELGNLVTELIAAKRRVEELEKKVSELQSQPAIQEAELQEIEQIQEQVARGQQWSAGMFRNAMMNAFSFSNPFN